MSLSNIIIQDVSELNLEDYLSFCIPPGKRAEQVFIKGMEGRKRWAQEMLARYGFFAKLAYIESNPAGIITFESIPAEKVVHIHCIFVSQKKHWHKGAAKQLLTTVIEETGKPQKWLGGEEPRALITRTFPGGAREQYTAREFFSQMGFKQAGDDPDLLIYPFDEEFSYHPRKPEYIPQKEDKGKALIIHGPSHCPFTYGFFLKTEQAIVEIAPDLPIRWIDRSQEPEEFNKRGNYEGCVVNAVPVRSFVLYTEGFSREVRKALKSDPGI